MRASAVPGPVVVGAAFLAGAVPFSQVFARRRAGVDLRSVGSGTVSGTGLYEVTGFSTLAVAGVLEIAKGAVGPLLAGPRRRPALAAAAAGAAVAGHNGSPFLRGAGGRGISPAVGALLATAPVGGAVLLGGMAVGRLAGETAIGSAVADAALVPVVGAVHGANGRRAAWAVLAPMIAKRLAGNRPPASASVLLPRLLLDRDTWSKAR